jgi:serine/threonine protein phosphatase PrpC
VSAFRLVSAARSDRGCVRPVNEDSYLARPDLGLWAVADGMGGHTQGDYASRLVTDRLGAIPPADDAPGLLRLVEETLGACHEALSARGGTDLICGATIAALLAFDAHYACVWAGDSRIYRRRDGQLQQLTRDHSVAQELIDAGQIDASAAQAHPHAHHVTRAVGVVGPLELDVLQGSFAAGDLFLLCTDGLTGELEDGALGMLLDGPDPQASADRLLARALAAGGRDNVTLIVLGCAADDADDTTLPPLPLDPET